MRNLIYKIIIMFLICTCLVGWNSRDSVVNDYTLANNHTMQKKKKTIKKKKVKTKTEKELKLEHLSEATGLNVVDFEEISCILTYYTDLPCENGGYIVTASGQSLTYGIIANNLLSFGTNVYFEDMGIFNVQDRGYSGFNCYNRYDVFIPRNYGESDSNYLTRVNNMGKTNINGYILIIS